MLDCYEQIRQQYLSQFSDYQWCTPVTWMLTYPRHWSRLVGPRQTSAVSSAVCWDACLCQLHPRPHPRHTLLHHASFQATSAAQMMPTARHLEPGILHNCTASHPKHHPQCSLFSKDLNRFFIFLTTYCHIYYRWIIRQCISSWSLRKTSVALGLSNGEQTWVSQYTAENKWQHYETQRKCGGNGTHKESAHTVSFTDLDFVLNILKHSKFEQLLNYNSIDLWW